MAKYSPQFVTYTGDAVADGRDQGLWEDWFEALQEYWLTPEGYLIPILPCLGNHERNAINYYKEYLLPGNEQWCSVNYAPYLHIICLNSEADISGVQLSWLKGDLSKYCNCTWKVAFFHEPPYSSGPHGSRLDIREAWCPLFDKYHVDVVICVTITITRDLSL